MDNAIDAESGASATGVTVGGDGATIVGNRFTTRRGKWRDCLVIGGENDLVVSGNTLALMATCFRGASPAHPATTTPFAHDVNTQPGFFCFAVEPEPGSRTSLCKRTTADCELSRRGELAAGASAGECVARGVAFCTSYSGSAEGRPFLHSMCTGDAAGCEALRRQAATDGYGGITACVETS